MDKFMQHGKLEVGTHCSSQPIRCQEEVTDDQ